MQTHDIFVRQLNIENKSHRYFGSILKAFRAIGAVLEQIESLHKTELEASREGRVFRSVCVAIFLLPSPCLHFENRTTVCMEYPARTSPRTTRGSEPDNAAGRGQEAHAGRAANLSLFTESYDLYRRYLKFR